MTQTDSNTGAADRESGHTRVLNASREHVVHAFREPEHFAQCWGPKGFRRTIIHSFDFRQGGRLQLTSSLQSEALDSTIRDVLRKLV